MAGGTGKDVGPVVYLVGALGAAVILVGGGWLLGQGSDGSTNGPGPVVNGGDTSSSGGVGVKDTIADLHVSATANTGAAFTALQDGNYIFRLKSGIYSTAPGLRRTVIRGYFNRSVVWGDVFGRPHPVQQDYELGCFENNATGNPTCGIGNEVTVFLRAEQYVRWIIMEDQNSFGGNEGEVVVSIVRRT